MDEKEILSEFINWLYYKNGAFGIDEVLEDPDDAIDRFMSYRNDPDPFRGSSTK